MRIFIQFSIVACIAFGAVVSCKKKGTTTQPEDQFDRAAMLTNVGNNIILPAYTAFSGACNSLDSAVVDFNASPDAVKLTNVQELFRQAYRSWESASSFEFGPAGQAFLSQSVNTFPCDPAKINANITSGSYNLDAIGNLDAKGLPGMDYLLFGTGANNAEVLDQYTTDAQAVNRKAYLADLSSAVKTVAGSVLHSWLPAGGNYINTFVTATGTDVGSSLGQLINQVDFDIDILKNYRLGVPLGKQSMGVLYPTKVEAYYCGISSELAVLQLQSLQNIYLGASGSGLDDYLAAINAQYNGGSLDEAIQAQFLSAITHMQAVPDPLSAQVAANSVAANDAYTEVQKLLVLMKTDMPSSLGVLITYEDTDGD